MKQNDAQVGVPGVLYTGTLSAIEASFAIAGQQAYATDTGMVGYYDGSIWVWGESDPVFMSRALTTSHYTGWPNRTGTALIFTSGSGAGARTLTVSGSASFDHYEHGIKYTTGSAGLSAVIPNVTGFYWAWITSGSALNVSTTPPGFDKNLAASVYWNADTQKGLLADERHWMGRDRWMHEYLHQTVGTRYASGLAGTFTSGSALVSSGEMYDEDIEIVIPNTTQFNVIYKNGNANWQWTSGSVPYIAIGNILQYNNGNNLADTGSSDYVAYWIFGTNQTGNPIVSMMGQRSDNTLANARANNTPDSLSYGQLPSAEMKLLYRVLFRRTAGPAVTYVETADYRAVSNLPVTNYTATDHSTLSNLGFSQSGHTGFQQGLTYPASVTAGSAADIQLVADNAAPGVNKYYGTGASGSKGFYDLPAAGSAAGTTNHAALSNLDFLSSGHTGFQQVVSWSMSLSGSTSGSTIIATLDNDVETPGQFQFYGTDSAGNKGWYSTGNNHNDVWFGSGVDSNVTLDGTNIYTWASKAGSGSSAVYTMLRDVYTTNITVSSGVTLITAGYRLFVNTLLTNSGTIHNNGYGASGSAAGAGGLAGYFAGGTAGGAGKANVAAAAGTVGTAPTTLTLAGGLGGKGGSVNSVTGALTAYLGGRGGYVASPWPAAATGGGRIINDAIKIKENYHHTSGAAQIRVTPSTGGGGGAVSGSCPGGYSGGGGGGGGVCFVAARTLDNDNGIISANGGVGGNADNRNYDGGANPLTTFGGGGGGGGGILGVVYATLINPGTIQADGGLGGTGDGGNGNITQPICELISVGGAAGAASGTNILTLNTVTDVAITNPKSAFLLAIHDAAYSARPTDPTVIGGGFSSGWSLVKKSIFNSGSAALYVYKPVNTVLYMKEDTYPIVITFSTAGSSSGLVMEIDNVYTVIQSGSAAGASGSSITWNLPSATSGSCNATIGIVAKTAGTGNTAGAGFVKVNDRTTAPQIVTEEKPNSQTIAMSWTTVANWGGVGVELGTNLGFNGSYGVPGECLVYKV